MSEPAVTVIVATYNRPAILRCTLQSLQAQTFTDWRALVIGDACAPETAEVVHRFGDPRMRFINLASRCGDQSGPNSIGAALTTSPLLAFVNHDDLLLPDHLDLSVRQLATHNADAVVARVVRAYETGASGVPPDVVCECAPPAHVSGRRVATANHTTTFEPVSAWLFTRAFVERVGEWTDAGALYRTPFNDWLLRACAAGMRVAYSNAVSVVHMQVHYAPRHDAPAYSAPAHAHEALLERLRQQSPDALRAEWIGDAARHRTRRRRDQWQRFRAQRWPAQAQQLMDACQRAVEAPAAWLIGALIWRGRLLGVDGYDLWCAALGRPRGFWRTQALRRRTGTIGHVPADRPALLADARRQLDAMR